MSTACLKNQEILFTQDFWNIRYLDFPPLSTYKANGNDIDLQYLRNVVDEGIRHFQNEKFLKCEYEVLSRIVYRMKGKFRTSKDFKSLAKLRQALRNYYSVKFVNCLENFNELIPCKSEDNEIYFPTKNTLDYLLVRLQGMVKLLERIVTSTKFVAELFHVRLKIGHFWKLGLIIFALVSRIYILAKYNTQYLCELYGKLLPFSTKLKNKSNRWLPKDYNLPQDLKLWLSVDWIDKDNDIIEISELPQTLDLLNLIEEDDDNDIQFCDEYVLIKDDKEADDIFNRFKNLLKIPIVDNTLFRGFDINDDIGEVIEINDNDEKLGDVNAISLSDTEYDVCSKIPGEQKETINTSKTKKKKRNVKNNNDVCFISLDSNSSSFPTNMKNEKEVTNKNTKMSDKNVSPNSGFVDFWKRKRKVSEDSVVLVENNDSNSKDSKKGLLNDESDLILSDLNVTSSEEYKKADMQSQQKGEPLDTSLIIMEKEIKTKSKMRFLQEKYSQKYEREFKKRKKAKHRNRYFGPKNKLIE